MDYAVDKESKIIDIADIKAILNTPPRTRKPILLIDMDGVTSNYYDRFLEIWKGRYPDRKVILGHEVESFYIEDAHPAEHHKDITDITRGPQFFRSLEPMPGTIEALKTIEASGEFEPFLCSAPDTDCVDQICHTEKAQWVEEHLGKYWLKRMVLTNDKTIINGDFLIDDKPIVKGVNSNPSWQHIVFDWGYNKEARAPYRLRGWQDWARLQTDLLSRWNTWKS